MVTIKVIELKIIKTIFILSLSSCLIFFEILHILCQLVLH
jgi:hypothetical protein